MRINIYAHKTKEVKKKCHKQEFRGRRDCKEITRRKGDIINNLINTEEERNK